MSVDTNINPTSKPSEVGVRVSGGYGAPLRGGESNIPLRGDLTGTRGGAGAAYSNVHSGGGEATSSHRYSNRNSQPFTDRELEQTLQQAKLSQGQEFIMFQRGKRSWKVGRCT